jgi:hypothetical protein
LLEVLDSPTIARLANEIAGDDQFCPINASRAKAVNQLLTSLGIPVVAWNNNYRGVKHIKERVNREERRLNQRLRSRHPMDGADLSHFGIVVWKEVEALLKVCARFYSRALSHLENTSVSRYLTHLDQPVTMGQILKDIWYIEGRIDETTQKECYALFEKPSPFNDFLDTPHELDLNSETDEWQEAHDRQVEFLQGNTQDYAGSYWAEVFMADVQVYRNFYAHENEDSVLSAGREKAECSFRAAKRMFDHITSEQVAKGELIPHLVVPVEIGVDRIERQIIRFVAASDLRNDYTYSDRSLVPVYRLPNWNEELEELRLFDFYLCCPMYRWALNPVLIPLEDVRPETLRQED